MANRTSIFSSPVELYSPFTHAALRLQGPHYNNASLTMTFYLMANALSDCIYMTSDEGEFFHKATSSDATACGVYIFSEPDQKIEVHFNYLDVPCEHGGLVSVRENIILIERPKEAHRKAI